MMQGRLVDVTAAIQSSRRIGGKGRKCLSAKTVRLKCKAAIVLARVGFPKGKSWDAARVRIDVHLLLVELASPVDETT